MRTINPKGVKTSQLHQYLLHAIAPRPIAFVSTIDAEGHPNLSPFSFFNVFSANPPIVIFSPARSGRTGATKDTFDNVQVVPECVINIVSYNLVQQASLTSTEYPKGVNEFKKAGLTEIPGVSVRVPRVKESPVQMECVVREVIELGKEGGAGNLVISEILLIHIDESIIDPSTDMIDQQKIDLVGRLGGDWYTRITSQSMFKVAKPITTLGIGIDQLPENIRFSRILTGNHLGQLGNVEKLPDATTVRQYKDSGAINEAFELYGRNLQQLDEHLHHIAARLLEDGRVDEAWKVLLSDQLN
jgi:flavin reductase (DIM6/NTAB) family NADH-FMN oxidoreductase RutF